jgi:nucleotide-binding universal stress UspA family protein
VVAALQDFLAETHLDTLRPEHRVSLSEPGNYAKLLEHIRVHKYFAESQAGRECAWEEIVAHWYDQVYLPVIETVRKNDLLAEFPRLTESDLYLWIIDHAYYLSQDLGQEIDPRSASEDFVARYGRSPRRLVSRLKNWVLSRLIPNTLEAGPPPGAWREMRLETGDTAHLFRDILVTVTGAESGWLALNQAAEIARRENGTLHGLHVVPAPISEEARANGEKVLDEFAFRCESQGVAHTRRLIEGDVATEIVERGRWVDLVVINQHREQGQWAERPLGTIFQTVTAQTARPILAVPGTNVTPMRRLLLAYDGSEKAREALFVFRHIVTHWGAQGVILTVAGGDADRDTLDQAWQYVQEAGGLNVTTRYEEGPVDDTILRVAREEGSDLLLMGSYGHQPLIKAVLGSTVDRVLRMAWFPVLICR